MRPPPPLRWVTDLALPPRCPGCGVIVEADHRFCVACWSSLHLLGPPWCAACHRPFAFDRGEGAVCAECLATPPRHAGIRAAVAYGDVARTLALRLKYGGRTGHAETAARLMRRLIPETADLLVPVPLHRWRLWQRGFNQAALIARALSRATGLPVDLDALRRRRATPLLRGLGARARAEAVRGAFAIAPARRHSLAGQAIILVDDVYTSGATSDACTRLLLGAGAASVTILCWARVLGEGDNN
ncbi:MAG: amidophosphoribosyltransferase [Sphingomonas sp. 28-66-16]|nr:MAG: amidophosphoribosyltransferase [Sphingomonas sp. 28-66-16]